MTCSNTIYIIPVIFQAIDHAKHEYNQYRIRLDVKLIRRCLLNMARILVDLPETSIGRARFLVTLEDIAKAKDCIDTIKTPEYHHGVSNRNQVQLLLAEAGVAFRRSQMYYKIQDSDIAISEKLITEAIFHVEQAKQIAKLENFKEEQIAEDFETYLKSDQLFYKANVKLDPQHKLNAMSSSTSSSDPPTDCGGKPVYSQTLIRELATDGEGHSGKETDVDN